MREPRSRQASIIGGSSESEVTALAVAPAGPSGPIAVTTVTPVGYEASASRKRSGLGSASATGQRYRRARLAYDPAACDGLFH